MYRRQMALKGILLIAMGLFLYSRIANGSLYFYINERFLGYTLFAVLALLAVGINYQFLLQRSAGTHGHHAHDEHHEHDRSEHAGYDHAHRLSWTGALLVLTPIALGVFVTPQPLGASAMDVRQVDVAGVGALPAAVRASQDKAAHERNVLEWNQTIQVTENPAEALAGEPVDVVGFVYRDERFASTQFFVTRFAVSCCAADAAVSGLVVEWPASAELANDTWLRVTGTIVPGTLGTSPLPVVQAAAIEEVEVPAQPYLYP